MNTIVNPNYMLIIPVVCKDIWNIVLLFFFLNTCTDIQTQLYAMNIHWFFFRVELVHNIKNDLLVSPGEPTSDSRSQWRGQTTAVLSEARGVCTGNGQGRCDTAIDCMDTGDKIPSAGTQYIFFLGQVNLMGIKFRFRNFLHVPVHYSFWIAHLTWIFKIWYTS